MHRVLHIISGLGPGGAQAVLQRLVVATAPEWVHEIVSLADASDGGATLRAMPAVVHALGMRGMRGALTSLSRLRSIAADFAPTVIQGWMYHGNLLASVCGRLMGASVPVIWNIRHSPEGEAHQGARTRLVVKANALLSSHPSAILFNSERSRQLHARLGFTQDRCIVIPNGFDTRYFTPDEERRRAWRAAAGIPADARVFGHAGRFHSIKNHIGALEAFLRLAAERSDVWLAMVGAGVDQNCGELMEAIQSSEHGCRVRLLGDETDMPRFYNGIDLLVLSSWAEAMPNVIGEAMACGTPCLSTDVGDAAVLIGDTGWTCSKVTVEALFAIMRVSSNLTNDERRARGADARRRIETTYSLPGMLAQYSRIYGQLVGLPAQAAVSGVERGG